MHNNSDAFFKLKVKKKSIFKNNVRTFLQKYFFHVKRFFLTNTFSFIFYLYRSLCFWKTYDINQQKL